MVPTQYSALQSGDASRAAPRALGGRTNEPLLRSGEKRFAFYVPKVAQSIFKRRDIVSGSCGWLGEDYTHFRNLLSAARAASGHAATG
jgi:hypothetical protein